MNSWPERRTCPSCAFAAKWNARVSELPIGVRLVGLDLGEQLVDEILMSFEYRHHSSVPRAGFRHPAAPRTGREQEKLAAGGKRLSMLRRRRTSFRLRRIARVLLELDAAGTRPAPAARGRAAVRLP